MRFEAFNSLPPEIRAFILISIAVAYPMFDIGFELAVYGEVFFEKIFAIWSICTALLIALLIIPGKYFRIPAIAWFATGFPSLWFALVLIGRSIPEWSLPGTIIFTLGLVIYLACLPYVLYVAVALAYPEIALLKKPARRSLLLQLPSYSSRPDLWRVQIISNF